MRIANARELVSLAKEMGYSSAEVRQLVRWVDGKQLQLIPLIEQAKITGVQVLTEKAPSNRGQMHEDTSPYDK